MTLYRARVRACARARARRPRRTRVRVRADRVDREGASLSLTANASRRFKNGNYVSTAYFQLVNVYRNLPFIIGKKSRKNRVKPKFARQDLVQGNLSRVRALQSS